MCKYQRFYYGNVSEGRKTLDGCYTAKNGVGTLIQDIWRTELLITIRAVCALYCTCTCI